MYFQNPEHYTQAAFRKSLLLCTGWRLVKRNQVFIFKKCSPSIICNHQETPNQIGPNLKVEASLLFAGASISSLRRSDGLFAREKLLLSEGFSWLCTWWWEEGGLRNRSTSWSLETPVVYLEKCSGFRAKDWKRPSQLRKVSFAIVNFCFDISKSQH